MLYSRAGDYPPGQPIIYAEAFSPNTPEGVGPRCHGHGRIYTVTEQSMVPDPLLTIRERAVAAWPQAWGGQNQRDILVTLDGRSIFAVMPERAGDDRLSEWGLHGTFSSVISSMQLLLGCVLPNVEQSVSRWTKRRRLANYLGRAAGSPNLKEIESQL